ncbi:MAG: cache domain-containing protein [Burkholderiales bacterium]|nr:cache domain-containing protein [Burkholderiales bacterium]
MVLLPLAGVLPLLGAILLWWSNEAFDRVLITKIRSDLAVAQGYFDRTLAEVGASALAIAESKALHDALAAPAARQAALLESFRRRERLDFVNLRAADGSLRATHGGSASGHDPASPAFKASASSGEHVSVEVLSAAQLALIGPGAELARRVPVPLVPTLNAAPTVRAVEDRAMVLLATRTIRGTGDQAGQVLGHVQAGVLLNRNLAFIDHINEIVYPAGSLPFGSQGTATLFLDDVRISTNVRLFGGSAGTEARGEGEARDHRDDRAIGTRVSKIVRDAVLGEGRTWLDRAFVVSDWYVSGYLPLADSAGQRIGMLYVGYLERPFTVLKYAMLAAMGFVFFAAMVLAAFVSLRWARSIFRPLEQMEATMRSVQAGALEARVGRVASGDEIGRLAGHLDHLLDAVGEKTRELQRWNAELDAKVAERTRELEETQKHLVRSEKLATVGQLTASIAHEVNNPIAVIQGNLDLVRELLDAEAHAKVAPELKLVDAQIERMRLIVTQLLQFARPAEFAGYVDSVDVSRLLDESLVLVQHLLAKTRIEVRRDFRATGAAGTVAINRQELQQVFVNLLVNAIHAMPEGGRLELGTRTTGGEVWCEVADTGPGLPPELLAQLFQPFTTRKKDGTGLGLWISRGIVERYGGDIRADNRDRAAEGVTGARFVVVLKAETADMADMAEADETAEAAQVDATAAAGGSPRTPSA